MMIKNIVILIRKCYCKIVIYKIDCWFIIELLIYDAWRYIYRWLNQLSFQVILHIVEKNWIKTKLFKWKQFVFDVLFFD